MPGPTRPVQRLTRLLAVTALLTGLAVSTASPAAAQTGGEQPVRLSAKPVDQAGPYFDVTVPPGESRRLEVALGNHDDEPIAARTYAADAYTIHNGGFGAALRDAETTGTTTWLDYPPEVRTLQPGRATVRAFTVTVPEGTPAGEYLTSIALENEVPIKGEGGVAIDQVVRQVIAVAVRVPGPLVPDLAIAAAGHTVVAERSVVTVDVVNTGNMHLAPSADLVLHDDAGVVVSRVTVPMDSVYAGTETKVEVPLETVLRPGQYTVDLSLEDEGHDATAQARAIPLTVAAPEQTAGPATAVGQQFAEVFQSASNNLLLTTGVLAALVFTFAGSVAVFAARRRRLTEN